MHAFFPTCAAVLSCTLILGGCGSDRTTDYPNHSPETTRRVDDTKRNAQDKKDVINREYAEKSNNLDFRERQLREKYETKRKTVSLEADQELTKLDARRQELELQASFKGDPKDAPANAPDRNSDNVATDLREARNEIEEVERSAREKHLRIDRDEQQELIQLQKERNQANEAMREETLEVDRWTTKELESIDSDANKN